MQLLGPVRAEFDDQEINLGPARSRALFALLALRAGHVVSHDEIVDGLWADSPPGNPSSSVYTYINGLRRALGPHSSSSVLESIPPGYRLNADDVTVDATLFTRHLESGRALLASVPAAAAAEYRAARELWHGGPLTGASGPFAHTTRLRLLEQRFNLIEDHATAMLTLGHHDAVLDDLRELVGHYPLREQPRSLLMQALYRSGHVEDALAVFTDIELILGIELGIDPSAQLRQLRDRIAAGAPELRAGSPQRNVLTTSKPPVARVVPAQLPHEITTFVGRETDLARLRTAFTPAVPDAPMIGVLSGPAGVGKTTLALKVAHELITQFPDGQLFFNLRGFDPHEPAVSPVQALAAMLEALAADAFAPGQSEAELSAHFRSALAGKRMLIVLDNALSSEQVRPLLPGSSCLVLITSRNHLNGLVARDGACVIDLNPLPPEESSVFLAQLLGTEPTAESSGDLGRIAALCGHLPLALSIVARRLANRQAVRLSEVVDELSDENDRLNTLSADTDAIRPAFSWSYHALKPEPAQLFRRLGLYPGDEISTAAAAALNATSLASTRKLLDSLANTHLISWAGRDRYRIHDLLHLYTKELAHADETPHDNVDAIRRLLEWYLHTSNNATRWVDPGRESTRRRLEPPPADCHPTEFADNESARKWISVESSTLCVVLRHAADAGYDDHVWKIICLVWEEERKGPREREWTDLLEGALATANRLGNIPAKMWLTSELSYTYLYLQRIGPAKEYFDRSLELWSTDGADHPKSRLLQALALAGSAHILYFTGELQQALQYCHNALPVMRDENYEPGQIWILGLAGTIHRVMGNLPEAEALLQEGFAMCKAQQHRSLMLENFILLDLGLIEQSRGHLDEATVFLTQAVEVAQDMGNALNEVRMLHQLQTVLHDLGKVTEAELCKRQIQDLMVKNSISQALYETLSAY